MALVLKWTEEAADDLQSIAKYISRDSEFYAKAVVQKIVEKALHIPEAPEIGRMVPEIDNQAIRERFVYGYRLIYRLTTDVIWMIGIVHGAQRLEPVMDDRLSS